MLFINTILTKIQKFNKSVYNNSFVIQNIDWLIFAGIVALIFSSIFAQSDTIGNLAIFVIILTFIKMITKEGEKFELNLADKFLLVYFLIIIISVAGSSLFYYSLKGFFKTFIYLGFYVSLVHYFKENNDKIKYIFILLALTLSIETVIAFLQNFSAVDEISGWQDTSRLNPEEIMTRVYGSLKPYNPNLFGGYMLAAIPAFLTLPFCKIKLLNKYFTTIFAIAGGLLTSVALILTGCRGAYIGLFFELIILVLVTYKFLKSHYKKVFSAIVSVAAITVGLIVVSISSLRARIFSIFAMRSDSSNSFRFNVYNSCLNMFKDNWLLGIGCGNQNFREIYGLYMKTGFDALSAYNIYLEIAVESGIFALISFLTFIIINIAKAMKTIFSTDNFSKIVFVLAALLSVIGVLIHGMVDTVFFRPQIQFIFWTMIAIIRTNIK